MLRFGLRFPLKCVIAVGWLRITISLADRDERQNPKAVANERMQAPRQQVLFYGLRDLPDQTYMRFVESDA